MSMKHVLELLDLLDDPRINGQTVANCLELFGIEDITVTPLTGEKGTTEFIRCLIPGLHGKTRGGSAPTLGIVGRLGGLGARPSRIGFTSDGDGALSALATAAKLGNMHQLGDRLEGDVIVITHVCPNAPTRPHEPVPFMDSPVTSAACNAVEVEEGMDAVISIDTTKGNRILNVNGIAITPTVKDGYILQVSDDLLDILETVTGKLPHVLPITMQDITPYGNGIYHLNSILQPAVATAAPCVGLAITTQTKVAGCATGATHVIDIDDAVRFCIETAKAFGAGQLSFYDASSYERLISLYGPMSRLRR